MKITSLNRAILATLLLTLNTTNGFTLSGSLKSVGPLFDQINGENESKEKQAVFPGEDIAIESSKVVGMVENESGFEGVVKDLKIRYTIFQESRAAGYDFKQSMACAIAGEYDVADIREEIDDIIKTNPCVMFTWERSPSCKQAVAAFEKIGAETKNVRLDDPWSEGNPIRAEIGKMVGRSSVPMIFIGGKFVGGYDGGISEEAPGLLDLAFKGTLRPMLKKAGALNPDTAEVEQ